MNMAVWRAFVGLAMHLAFSARLRHEVDLSQLSEDLVTVVQETMQPSHVWLWLRPTGQNRKDQST